MASDYASDDYYNVLADHVVQALQADAKLGPGSGDALEVTTWEEEFRGDAAKYNANELPAVAVECGLSSRDPAAVGTDMKVFAVTVFVVTGAGREQLVDRTAKHFAARIERVMEQQDDPNKQLADVTADIDNAKAGSVTVSSLATAVGGGVLGGTMRGVAVLNFAIGLKFSIAND